MNRTSISTCHRMSHSTQHRTWHSTSHITTSSTICVKASPPRRNWLSELAVRAIAAIGARAWRACFVLIILTTPAAFAGDGNRLAYLDDDSPWYPSRTIPKLITPQWVGEPGVDAVVILAIDDMRGHEKWETYLRPILNRLKKIDGRAPVSIMTCQIDPADPHLQQWLKEGLSLECHTLDHPCPLFAKGNFAKAKETYDKNVDLMNKVPGNKPVAFRTPCCDSLNTVSPRFFAEMFNQRTAAGNFLQIDSSVFTLFTANDPDLPRDLVFDADGRERFRKYLPGDGRFVNYIEDYPYPYVVNRLCWEFPCMTPSDWQSQNLFKPGNPITPRDWKAALDCTVIKKGCFSAVFHPYGWIKPEQVVDFIDYAQTKYGKRVKFLTFKEAEQRLTKNVLGGEHLRDPQTGADNGVDFSPGEGLLLVSIDNKNGYKLRMCDYSDNHWSEIKFTGNRRSNSLGYPIQNPHIAQIVHLQTQATVVANETDHVVAVRAGWDDPIADLGVELKFVAAKFRLPAGAKLGDFEHDYGLRFVDLDGDGCEDVIISNEKESGIYLFTDMQHGWGRKVIAGKAGEPGALPPIAINGKNNGFFVHGRSLCWINETTDGLPGFVKRISFDEILKDVDPQGKSPEASLKSIQCAPGFRAELMAAEPLVEDPIAFAFGPDGKLWVVEMGDYPLGIDGKGKFGGKIKFLESTRGDGKYDKATTFLDGLGFPTGVLPWRNGILVTCAPDIFWVENVNGKPGKKEVLFTGFNQGNQQHRVNSLVWGLDNWLYVANGDSGGNIKSLKTGKTVSMSGRDLRIRPDTGEMEAQSGQTQYGRSRDDWGNHFGNNNSNPMYHFALDDHYLRRNPHATYPDPKHAVSVTPGAAPVFPISRTLPRFNDPGGANRFTSACSAIVYRDDLYYSKSPPANAGGSPAWTFVSEPVHNLVHREIMTPVGATFQSRRAPGEEKSEFVASSDNWFRPTMIQTGPDGCLWIADMYRAVIEHPQWIPPEWQKKLDLRAGHDKGRIYRIVPVHAKPRDVPRLDKLDAAGLVAALDSPNGWQRDTAQMMLIWNADLRSAQAVANLVLTSKRAETRAQAMYLLPAIPHHILTAITVKGAFRDPHPAVRRAAIKVWEGRLLNSSDVCDEMLKLVDDPDPQVRMQLAYTLGEWDDPRAGAALGRMVVANTGDPYIVAAALSSARDGNLDAMLRAALTDRQPSPAVRELMLVAARKNHRAAPRFIEDLAGSVQRTRNADQINMLGTLLESSQVRDLVPDPTLKVLSDLGLRLSGDSTLDLALRVAAVRLVGYGMDQWVEGARGLAKLLSPQTSEELQAASVLRLGRLNWAGHNELIKGWRGLGPKRRAAALAALLSQEAGVTAVLDAVDKRQIDANDIDAPSRQFLTSYKTPALRERAVKLLAGSIDPDRQRVVDAYKPALALRGDGEKGKALFAKVCAACHKLNGVGNEVGPELAALAGRSPEYLMIAILDPNRAVEARYVNYIAETKDGHTFSGLLQAETSTSITIVGAEGKPQTILRTNLESLTSTGKSAMPEGLEKDWKHQDLADLLAYVRSGRPAAKPKAFAGNKPAAIAAADDGSLTLTATAAEIYGPTLIFEPQYQNLGYWSSADDYASWTIKVPQGGRYLAVLDYACDNGNAGNTFAIDTDGGTLTGKVAGTGNWDTYRKLNAGVVSLPTGEQRVTMRSEGGIRGGALIDLKSIRLTPVK